MTARDAATQPDTTDEVVAEQDPTPAVDAGPPAVEPVDDTAPGGSRHPSGAHLADPDAADPDAAAAGDTDADTDSDATSPRRRGRRHRHAAGDESGTRSATDAPAGRRRRRWPFVAAVVVAAVFAAAMVVVFLVTRPDPVAGLSRAQQAAVDAASQEATNLQTYRRASFDQDFANAVAGATPDYAKNQIQPRKADLQKALQQGKRDASASVLSAGLQSSTATGAVVLVVTQAAQTADNGQSTPFVFSRLQITMQLVDGKWLLSDLKSVGLS